MPGELELELGDVPASGADGQRPRPELGRAEIAEGAPRARAYDAVGHEPNALLEGDERFLGVGPAPAVHVAQVRAGSAQGDLERCDVGVAHHPYGRRRGRGVCGERADRDDHGDYAHRYVFRQPPETLEPRRVKPAAEPLSFPGRGVAQPG